MFHDVLKSVVFFMFLCSSIQRKYDYRVKNLFGNERNAEFFIAIRDEYSTENDPGGLSGANLLVAHSALAVLFFGEGEVENVDYSNRIWNYDLKSEQFRLIRGYIPGDSESEPDEGFYGSNEYNEANFPSARAFSVGIVLPETQEFLFFTGGEYHGMALNDLWSYNWATEQWRFLRGSLLNETDARRTSISVEMGEYNPLNIPAGRSCANGIRIGPQEILILFGKTVQWNKNDVWIYNIVSNQYKWIHGLFELGQMVFDWEAVGEEGGQFSAKNIPRGRHSSVVWKPPREYPHSVFFYGGQSSDEVGKSTFLSDLWCFNFTLNMFRLVFGQIDPDLSVTLQQTSSFSFVNSPSSRFGYIVFSGQFKGSDDLLILTGYGRFWGITYYLNDMFEYSYSRNQFREIHSREVLPAAVYGGEEDSDSDSHGGFSEKAKLSGRKFAAFAQVGENELLIYGGRGCLSTAQHGTLNDMWVLSRRAICTPKCGEHGVCEHAPYSTSLSGGDSQNTVCVCTSKGYFGVDCKMRVTSVVAICISSLLAVIGMGFVGCVVCGAIFVFIRRIKRSVKGAERKARDRELFEKLVSTPNGTNRRSILDVVKSREMSTEFKFQANANLFQLDPSDLIVKRKIAGNKERDIWKCEYFSVEVALKAFSLERVDSQSKMNQLERELGLLMTISHPSCIAFIGAVQTGILIGFVTEFCPNGTLKEFMRKFRRENKQKLAYRDKLRVLYEIASGMLYLHETKKVIHRDLKMSNVLVDKFQASKVADFGLSREIQNISEKRLTHQCGTSYYMSPEMIRCEKYDYMTDSYSFGILSWVFLTEDVNPYGVAVSLGKINETLFKVAASPEYRPEIGRVHNRKLREMIRVCLRDKAGERIGFRQISRIIDREVVALNVLKIEHLDHI